jgi:predicted NAD/FAD-binding protein
VRERKTDPATLVVGTYTGPEDRYDEWVAAAAAVVEMLLLSEP